ncbi:MAG: aldehyde dehydrogenase family protein [Acidimicrobiales bacterium]
MRIANDSPYGLGGSVWGGTEQATMIAERVRTGTIQVNHFGMAFGAPLRRLQEPRGWAGSWAPRASTPSWRRRRSASIPRPPGRVSGA